MRNTFVNQLFKIAQADPKVILLTGDLGYGVLNPFWESLPNQIVNLGIAEQNMVGFAAGLAKSGKIVYVYSIGNFPTLRPLEQIRNDVVYHNLNVKIISIGTGFSYGSLGMSHHATEDLGIMRSIPGLNIFSPCDSIDVSEIVTLNYNNPTPTYIRLGRNENKLPFDLTFYPNLPYRTIKHGSKIAIFTHGDISLEIIKTYNLLLKDNILVDIYFFHTIKPLNQFQIELLIQDYKIIFVVEEHSKVGGLASAIKDEVSSFYNIKFFSFGLENKFTTNVGSQEYLRKINQIDSESIYNRIINQLKKS